MQAPGRGDAPPLAVEIWTLEPKRIADAAWPRLAAVLDDAERGHAARLRREPDRRCYVAAHALLRHLLERAGAGPAASLRLTPGPAGKPALVRAPGTPDLRFSLSHTEGLAAAAVSLGHEIGLDAEARDGRAVDPTVADGWFAPAETALLRSLPEGTQRRDAFVRLWTLKEAFVKATGEGLRQALHSFAFGPLDPPRVTFHDPSLGDPASWRFRCIDLGRHALALAVRAEGAGALEVRQRPWRAEAGAVPPGPLP